jgi:DNA-directed RNA polymerase
VSLRVGAVLQDSKMEEQIELEIEAIQRGVQRYRKLAAEAEGRGDAAALKPIERLLVHWFPDLVNAIKVEQEAVTAGKSGPGRSIGGPLVAACPAEAAAVITMHTLLGRTVANNTGDLLLKASYAVGSAVVAELHAEQIRANNAADWDALDSRFRRLTAARVNAWAKKSLADHLWKRKACVAAGSTLIYLATEICLLNNHKGDWEKVFIHESQWRDKKRKGCIRLSNTCLDKIEDGHLFRQHLRPRFMPMVVKPFPWSAEHPGGYVRVRTPLISKPANEQIRAFKESNTDQVFEALNAISQVGWKINQRLLAVAEEIWEQGGGVGMLPKADLAPLPERPSDISTNEAAKKSWKAAAHEIHGANAKLRGARIEYLQKISLARRFVNEPMIAFPHQFDFRTRLYPVPVYLNHHGDDLARALLLLCRRVPLTDRGRWWLAVHAANMWGHDKADFAGRVAFTQDMMPDIVRTNDDPMRMIDFWSRAEDPYQFLVACMAICDDKIGECLPVQIDGTCNGSQHLCAATRDEQGGKWVNLVPSPTPQDAYGRVVVAVDEKLRGMTDPMSRLVHPFITRKCLKQPVMTSNYNVTRIGARDQIKARLKEAGFPKDDLRKASMFLANMTLESIGDTFPGPQLLMRWIEECTKVICHKYPMEGLAWTTPLGVRCVQPYRKISTVEVRTVLQRVVLGHRRDDLPVAKGKQRQGGPPNIVHSWDACHEMGTAIAMHADDMDFAAVHDAYWAHASNMDNLAFHTREQFVSMHEMDLVEQLAAEWADLYPKCDFPAPPPMGQLDLTEIMNSEYFFS